MELTFATDDIQVVSVSDGVEAVAQIDADRPDIVLADVGMPRLDGLGVASHIKKAPALKDIPVLLLTGAFDPIDEDRARACGCDGVLIKPFEPQQLVRRVRELLRAQPPRPRAPVGAPAAETVTARGGRFGRAGPGFTSQSNGIPLRTGSVADGRADRRPADCRDDERSECAGRCRGRIHILAAIRPPIRVDVRVWPRPP